MDTEVHEIFTSFQGEGGTVSGSCAGRRQVFVRLRGCDVRCDWCDTAHLLGPSGQPALVEAAPGSRRRNIDNPMTPAQVVDAVIALRTPSLHSVSFTGGEPLLHVPFLKKVFTILKKKKLPVFLETNGNDPAAAKKVAKLVDVASVDIKDRTAGAHGDKEWEELVAREVASAVAFKKEGCATYAKLVVTGRTREQDVGYVAKLLAKTDVPLAIQPVTPLGDALPPSLRLLLSFADAACEHLPVEAVSLSVQGHRQAGFP